MRFFHNSYENKIVRKNNFFCLFLNLLDNAVLFVQQLDVYHFILLVISTLLQ